MERTVVNPFKKLDKKLKDIFCIPNPLKLELMQYQGLTKITPWVNYCFIFDSDIEEEDGLCALLLVTIRVLLSSGPGYDTPFGPSKRAVIMDDWEIVEVLKNGISITHKYQRMSANYLELSKQVEKEYARIIQSGDGL